MMHMAITFIDTTVSGSTTCARVPPRHSLYGRRLGPAPSGLHARVQSRAAGTGAPRMDVPVAFVASTARSLEDARSMPR